MKIESLGFRQMHDAQIAELLGFIDYSLNAAAMADPEVYEEMNLKAQELVEIFGGMQMVTETSLEI
tara:strand:+ start:224 stop:421 length:198 start_codon:yes stop_codon:yes gene_type:complete